MCGRQRGTGGAAFLAGGPARPLQAQRTHQQRHTRQVRLADSLHFDID